MWGCGVTYSLSGVTTSTASTVRGLRATVATAVVVGLGASAHHMGGGADLQPLAAALLVLLVGPLAWTLLRRRTSLLRMLVATEVGQLVTHVALSTMAGSAGGEAVRAHVHGGGALPAATVHASMTTSVSLPMVLAHLVAGLLAALVLTLGPDALRRLVPHLLPAHRDVVVPGTLRSRPAEAPRRRLTGRTVRPLGGRAPPALAC